MKKRGFTLIELLVVIAIIAILAAILFPVFAKAREKARQAACLSNVKQMALGAYMYADDNDSMLPLYIWWEGTTPRFLIDQIIPYMKTKQINKCPSFPMPEAYSDGGRNAGYGWNRRQKGTWNLPNVDAMGVIGYGDGTSGTPGPSAKIDGMTNPARVFLVADASYDVICAGDYIRWKAYAYGWWGDYLPGMGDVLGMPYPSGMTFDDGSSASVLASDANHGRHSGGVNMGYCDGHAKFLKTSKYILEGGKAQSSDPAIYTDSDWCTNAK